MRERDRERLRKRNRKETKEVSVFFRRNYWFYLYLWRARSSCFNIIHFFEKMSSFSCLHQLIINKHHSKCKNYFDHSYKSLFLPFSALFSHLLWSTNVFNIYVLLTAPSLISEGCLFYMYPQLYSSAPILSRE